MQFAATTGMRSTEFWIGLIVPILVILFGKQLGLQLSPEELYALVGASGLYGVSRGVAKIGEAKSSG